LSCIAVVHSWKGFGWGFIMLLAGLQTIDRQLYEAATVDGANSWQKFWNVTVPMMIPVIVVVVILTILGSMQSFILVLSMTPGGLGGHTDVPVLQILTTMTTFKEYGTACAMGVVFAGILISISAFFKLISDRMKQA
jgi:ABC-type sugar transport system permease subunit